MTQQERHAYWRSTFTSLVWLSGGFVFALLVPFFMAALPIPAPLPRMVYLVVVGMALAELGIGSTVMLLFYRQYVRATRIER